MWRFILVTFGFLGFAFYELSGGADYQASDTSLQAHMKRERERAKATRLARAKTAEFESLRIARAEPADPNGGAKPSTDVDAKAIDAALAAALDQDKGKTVTQIVSHVSNDTSPEMVTTALIGLEDLTRRSGNDAQVTLASSGKQQGFGALGATLEMSPRDDVAVTRSDTETTQVAIASSRSADMRRVTGNVVNMRAGPGTDYGRLDQLRQGDRVRVLEDLGNGWLRLEVEETGHVGYMADWLVAAAN